MKTKIFNLHDSIVRDLEDIAPKGQQTQWVARAIIEKLERPENVELLVKIRIAKAQVAAARAQHHGETGLPPAEILPAYRPLKKEVDVWV